MTVRTKQGQSFNTCQEHNKNDYLLLPEVTQSIGENLLDALCIKYSSQPSGLIIYDDRLKANIIGEFSVDEFRKIYQTRKPIVRRQYSEVQDIDQISYRSLTHNTRIGDRYIPIVAKIIPGTALPLLILMGRDFRDDHAESPAQQKQVNELNHPRIYFFKREKNF